MSDPFQTESHSSSLKTAALVGAVVALLAANVYLYLQVDQLRTDLAKTKEAVVTELTNLRDSSSALSANARKSLDTLRTELESTRKQTSVAVTVAKTEAKEYTKEVAQQLTEEQKKAQSQLNSQLREVKDSATTANAKIGDVSGEVSQVKNQVASTRGELEKTIAELKKVTGDLGITSGLVATNGKELAALKRLGERNYFEFNLARAKNPQKIADISLLLKKTDPKKNKYTLEVLADDKRVEKRDKGVNEPIQFMVSKSRIPYEIIVNEVKKDSIVGYLATPKDLIPR
jgi:chromosome segregation ATPase